MSIVKVGDVYPTNNGSSVTVSKYENSHKITVRFNDNTNYECLVRAQHLRGGVIKNPYLPLVAGVGFFGEGAHKAYQGGRSTPEYKRWTFMLLRCYDDETLKNHPTYQGCCVNPV